MNILTAEQTSGLTRFRFRVFGERMPAVGGLAKRYQRLKRPDIPEHGLRQIAGPTPANWPNSCVICRWNAFKDEKTWWLAPG